MAKNILLNDNDAPTKDKKTSKRSKKKTKATTQPSWIQKANDFWADERTRSVSGILALAASVVCSLAIISSFFTGDLDIRIIQNAPIAQEVEAYHNVLGSVGAHLGYWLARQGLGIGALGIPFLLFLVGFGWLTDRRLLPLAKSFRLAAFLAVFTPWALAFLSHHSENGAAIANSALNDHITGATGLWLLGQGLHHAGFVGSAGILIVTLALILAFNAPSRFRRIGEWIDGWFHSSEEAMKEEDARDEAAVKETMATDDASVDSAPSRNENILLTPNPELTSDTSQADESEVAVATEVPFTLDSETPSTMSTQMEDNPPQEEPIEATQDASPREETPEAPSSVTYEAEKKDEDSEEVEFEVKEAQEEESLSSEELKDLVEDFGEEYDPTLDLGRFQLPNVDKLVNHGDGKNRVTDAELQQNKENILRTLSNFNIEVSKITAEVGPTVTLYEIVPAPGIRISKIKNLEDDIALSLAALGIRIIAPIPGKGTIGIEVPNSNPDVVSMRTLIASDKFQNSDAALPIALGKTISNETYVFDMAKMPHLLMAGATGQGKSVGLNAMLVSMLYRRHPSQLKFVLVDPKKVELTLYNKIVRHYLAQLPDSEDAIITDTSKVVSTLNSLCVEMDQRYELLKAAQCRNIKEYNAKFIKRKIIPGQADGHPDNGKDLHRMGHHYMPYIVLVVDEFADLIMTAGKEVETPIARLAQLARAIGIHLIIATQRPSVNIITGTIKANFPARVAFRVTSKIDSRTILDAGGADQLIGRGDLLMSTGNDLIRLQCGFVDTPEVEEICEFIGSQQGYPTPYELPPPPAEASDSSGTLDDDDRDPMFEEAARVLVMHQQGSTSLLQRKLKLGYNRAGRLIDQLESAGIIGPFEGSKARKVLVPDEASLEQLLQSSSATTE